MLLHSIVQLSFPLYTFVTYCVCCHEVKHVMMLLLLLQLMMFFVCSTSLLHHSALLFNDTYEKLRNADIPSITSC